MADRLLTPSKITAWLDFAHFLTLQHEVEDGARAEAGSAASARSATDAAGQGTRARAGLPRRLPSRGRRTSTRCPIATGDNESFADWVDRASAMCVATGTTSCTRCPSFTTACAASPTSSSGSMCPSRHVHLRAGRRQARSRRGQARARAPAVLLRGCDRGARACGPSTSTSGWAAVSTSRSASPRSSPTGARIRSQLVGCSTRPRHRDEPGAVHALRVLRVRRPLRG